MCTKTFLEMFQCKNIFCQAIFVSKNQRLMQNTLETILFPNRKTLYECTKIVITRHLWLVVVGRRVTLQNYIFKIKSLLFKNSVLETSPPEEFASLAQKTLNASPGSRALPGHSRAGLGPR